MPKEPCTHVHIKSAKKQKSDTTVRNSTSNKQKKSRNTKQSKTKVRIHPLHEYTYQDDVLITLHPSPAATFTDKCERKQVEKMETKIANHLYDFNTPIHGEARNRIAIGECDEDVFDTYMSRTMPAHLYKREVEYTPFESRDFGTDSYRTIVYEFQNPNFPSFDDTDWAKFYTIIDHSNTATSFKEIGVKIPNHFEQAPYRCIARKLTISFDTKREVYYVHFGNWVQKKCEIAKENSDIVAWCDSI